MNAGPISRQRVAPVFMAISLALTASFAAIATSAAQSDEPVTIEFWDPDTRDDEAMATVIEGFEAANPGVNVNVTVVPFAEYVTKLQTACSTDTMPDMFLAFASIAENMAFSGCSQPVDDIVDDIGRDNFFENNLTGTTIDGQLWSVPLHIVGHLLWYRADWLNEAGFEPPSTWEEMRTIAEHFTDGDRYGFGYYNRPPEPEVLLSLMGANGASTFGPDGEVVIDSPATVEALEMTADLASSAPPGANANSENEMRLQFVDGCCAMAISSGSFAGVLAENPEAREVISAVPVPINAGDRGALGEFSSLAISEQTEKRDAVKAFLEYWYAPDVHEQWGIDGVVGLVPALRPVLDGSAYWESENVAPLEGALRAAVETGRTGVRTGATYGPNQCAAQVLAEGVWEEMADRVTIGGETPEEVAAWAQERIEGICSSL